MQYLFYFRIYLLNISNIPYGCYNWYLSKSFENIFKYFGASGEWAYRCDCLLHVCVECWKDVCGLLFQNRFIIGYLKIVAQLIIVIDLQINQCKISINLLAFSLLTKVQSQLKVRTFKLSIVNSTKVQSQSNFTMPNHVYSFIFSPNKKLN